MSSATLFSCASSQPRWSSSVRITRTPLVAVPLIGLLLLTILPLPTSAFMIPGVKSTGSRAATKSHPVLGLCPLSCSVICATSTTTTTIFGAGATSYDDEKEGEQVLSLHTLEIPLQDDPGNYRTFLEEYFKGSNLLRWHLGSVDTEKGVAHAEVVIVSSTGVTVPLSP